MRRLIGCMVGAGLSLAVTAEAKAAAWTSEQLEAGAQAYAACLFKQRPMFADAYLHAFPGTPELTRAVRSAGVSTQLCLSGPYVMGIRVPHIRLRQRLAELALRRDYPLIPMAIPDRLLSKPWFQDAPAPARLGNDAITWWTMQKFGFCLAKSDWPKFAGFLNASDDVEQRRALAAVQPLFAGCITPGQKLTVDVPQLRASALETAYHVLYQR